MSNIPEIFVTGKSAYPGDPPSSYTMVTKPNNNFLTKAIATIGKVFTGLLPDEGGRATTTDTSLIIKTSPTIWEYEMFRMEWDRRTITREIDLMLKTDTRAKRANRVFASTAVRKGMTVTVTSEISEDIANKAQEIINQIMRDAQVNAKLASWARILLKEGDLFLNPVIDIKNKKIKTIKRLPAISMQREEGMDGNFFDLDKAFRQIDPISLLIIQDFPLWAINHIRWDHEEGERYGNSQYLQCRGYWRKLNMTEEDLVVRRRTRAVPRRVHILGNKDNPGTQTDIDNYKAKNALNPRNAQVTTDYYINGLGDVKDLNADAQLDHIKDIEHLQEVYMIGTGVPLHMLGFGKNVNRDIVEDQIKQFKEDAQELRDLIEYGDSSPYSGLRFIFDFGLALAGIDPAMVEYNIRWAEEDNETASERLKRVVVARSAQPKPVMSHKTAVAITAKDNGFENDAAIEAELEEIELELEQDRLDQQTLKEELNPANPTTSPASHAIVAKEAMDAVIAAKKKDIFPLHGAKAAVIEKQFVRVLKKHFAKVSRELKKNTAEHVKKTNLLGSMLDDNTPKLVEQFIDDYQDIWDQLEPELQEEYLNLYLKSSLAARSRIANESDIKIADNFVNPELQKYLKEQSSSRVTKINETNRSLLRDELSEAYKNGEKTSQWQARIDKVLGLSTPSGRADMIARTELAFGYSRGLIATYHEVGISKVEWLSVLDNRTCSICRERHGNVYQLSKVEDMIPAHPRCRCTIVSAD